MIAASFIIGFSLLYSQLSITSARARLDPVEFEHLSPPSPTVADVLSLGHRSLAADMVWIAMIVDYSEHRRLGRRPPYMYETALLLSDLDPHFEALYDWFTGAHLVAVGVADENRIEQTTSVLERAMAAFPNNWEYPYAAALNYIGHSKGASKERRLRELRRGLDFALLAASLPGADDQAVRVARWFERRIDQLSGGSSVQDEAEVIDELLALLRQTRDDGMASQVEQQLIARGVSRDRIRAARRPSRRHVERWKAGPYRELPFDFWIQVQSEGG